MQRILRRIESRMAEYRDAPFLDFLRDANVDPQTKLAFVPHVAHFVLTFGDLCRFLLPEDPPGDRFQELVNANSREDQDHWRWYLGDLAILGQDQPIPLSRAIALIWSDRNRRTRLLSYNLCHLALASDSLGKLVLVHCIEGAFKATVEDLAGAAAQFTASTGKKLVYLGGRHSDAESSHTIEQDDVRTGIGDVEISPEAYDRYVAIVDKCFVLFGDFSDEMYEIALSLQAPTQARGA